MGTPVIVALRSALWLALGGCASATLSGGDDVDGGGGRDAAVDAGVDVPTDACPDTDGDGACNLVDVCPGFDDAVDADLDTVADGCDQCPGQDDRVDLNANLVADCTELQLRTISVKSVAGNLWRGWYSSSGSHSSTNDNTLTGVSVSTYNSYFVFPMLGFTATAITDVTLELELEAYTSADASETLSVWDVTTPAATVEASTSSTPIFSDLQSGAPYGTFTATAAQLTTILSIPLSAQAATDAQAKLGGDFAVGVHLDGPPGWVRFGNTPAGATPTIARVVIKYLP